MPPSIKIPSRATQGLQQPLTRIRPIKPSVAENLESSPVNIVLWQLPIIAPLSAWLMRKGNNLGTVGTPLKWFGKALGAPHEFLDKHKVGDVAQGGDAATGALFKHSTVVMGKIGDTAEKAFQSVDEMSGGWLGKKRTAHAEKRGKLATSTLETAAKSHTEGLDNLAKVEAAMPKGAQYQKAHDALAAMRAGLSKMPAHAEPAVLHQRVKLMNDSRMTIEKALSPASRGERKTVRKALSDYAKSVMASHEALESGERATASAALRGNFGALKAVPERIMNLSGSQAANHSLYALSQGASAIRAGRALSSRFDTIKNMYASVTHTDIKDVSGLKIIFGMTKLPPSMSGTVKHYWRGALPEVLSNIAGMIVFHKTMKSGSLGKTLLLGAGVQGATMGVSALVAPKNDLLDAYRKIAESHAVGDNDVPKAAYGALIVAAKPALRSLNQDDPALLQVADHYARLHAKASLVLRDMDSGTFDKLYAEAKAAAAKKPVVTTVPAASGVQTEQIKDTAETPSVPSSKAEQPVVGDFSAKLAAEGRKTARTAPELPASRVEALQSQSEQPNMATR